MNRLIQFQDAQDRVSLELQFILSTFSQEPLFIQTLQQLQAHLESMPSALDLIREGKLRKMVKNPAVIHVFNFIILKQLTISKIVLAQALQVMKLKIRKLFSILNDLFQLILQIFELNQGLSPNSFIESLHFCISKARERAENRIKILKSFLERLSDLLQLKTSEEDFQYDGKSKIQRFMEDLKYATVQNSIFLDHKETEFETLFALKVSFSGYLSKKKTMMINLDLNPSQSRKLLYWQKEDPFTKLMYKKGGQPQEEKKSKRRIKRCSSF